MTNLICIDRFVDVLVSLQRKSTLIHLSVQNVNKVIAQIG